MRLSVAQHTIQCDQLPTIRWDRFTELWLCLLIAIIGVMYAFVIQFDKSWLGVIFHLLIMSTAVPPILFGMVWLPHLVFGRSRFSYHLSAFLLTSFFLLLGLFYLMNEFSNTLWAENITARLIIEYTHQLPTLVAALPVTTDVWVAGGVLTLLLSLVLYFVSWRLSYALWIDVRFPWGDEEKPTALTSVGAPTVALIVVLGNIFFVYAITLYLYLFKLYGLLDQALLLFLAAAILSLYCVVNPRFWSFVDLLNAVLDHRSLFRRHLWFPPFRPLQIGIVAAILIHLSTSVYLIGFRLGFGAFSAEPVISLFFSAEAVGGALTPLRTEIAHQDRIAQSEYQAVDIKGSRPNVILIVVDALRADHLPMHGYTRQTTPFLSDLLAQGKLQKIPLALSTCANSYCGILSIFASKPFHYLSDDNLKVYDLLHDQGYQVNFVASGAHTSFYNLKRAYGTKIDFFRSGEESDWGTDDDRLIFDGLEQMPITAGVPSFLYIHLMSVHLLGVKVPEYAHFQPTLLNLNKSLLNTNRDVLLNRYDNGILQADDYIKRIFQILQKKGLLDDTLLIITSDHGENLEIDTPLGHGDSLNHRQINIPMLVFATNKKRAILADSATHIDIAPTILDYLGQPIPSVWYGRSIFQPPTERFTFHETVKYPPVRGVVWWQSDRAYKYVLTKDEYSLYDIRSDIGENHNLITSADSRLIEVLQAQFNHFWESPNIRNAD